MELELDKASDLPLHRQIRRQFTRLIGQNRLVVGDSLPSTREIARDFGISRLTVLKAFQAMERAGIVGVRPGRGYFVRHRQSEADDEKPADLVGVPANFRIAFEESYSETVRSAREMPLSFAAGYPDVRLLPLKQVRRIITRVTEAERCGDLLYQAPGGHPRLKSELSRYLAERDIPLSDDLDILVTTVRLTERCWL